MTTAAFPILHQPPTSRPDALRSIPWALIAPHNEQAERNHSQSLRRLAERGGLSPAEAVAVIEGRPWTELCAMNETECESRLRDLVAAN